MDKTDMIDRALAMIAEDMDDLEGKAATAHSLDECSDPLMCGQHDGETGDALSGLGTGEPKEPGSVVIEVKGHGGMPSLDGATEGPAEDGLSDDDAEELRKLLK